MFEISESAPSIYSEKFLIRSYHTDLNRKLTLPKLCSFFQDIAGRHTLACNVGWDVLDEANLFWVLSRLKIQVAKMPDWETTIEVKTWSNGVSGIMAIRNFQVLDENGNELIRAISSWLLLNTETRRITRPNDFMKNFPFNDSKLFKDEPERLEVIDGAQFFDAKPVLFTEIDMNQHMNNVCYIERILNTYSYDFLKENQIEEFQVNFMKEAKIGDELAVKISKTNEGDTAGIVSEDHQTEFIQAMLKWKIKA